MTRTVLCLALLVVLVTAALGAVTEEEVNEHPDHRGKCYDAKRNEGYAIGKTWHRIKEPCVQFSCHKGKTNGKYIIRATSCDPVQRPKPPCSLKEGNHKASYPRCCPSVECPNN
ncbi:U-scoloptoxin(16)-Er8a [Anabrus simplex]|uniref:U-scoloptoxin(16)-Er8a n=1 Tax=Anabrus simplex TaxID=316456 RepID=UPI0035A30022